MREAKAFGSLWQDPIVATLLKKQARIAFKE